MKTFVDGIVELASDILATDATAELIALPVVGLVIFLLVVRFTGGPFGLKVTAFFRIILVLLVPLAAAIAALVAVRMFLLPQDAGTGLKIGVQVGVGAVVVFAIALPLQCFLQKGNYVECMFTFFAGLIAAVLVVVLVRATWHAAVRGGGSMDTIRDRTERIEGELSE
jgi:hypothetical protein